MRIGPTARKVLRTFLPRTLEHRIRVFLTPTVAEGWERNARRFKGREGEYLGDDWSDPEATGIDVAAEEVVGYLDERVFSPFPGDPDVILEIGPGGGRFTRILLPKCRKLIAADIAPSMLDLLEQRFEGEAKLECRALDGQGLSPIPDDSVNAAFSYAVFAHLQHWDMFHYLCELRRVLVPGGKAVIEFPNTFSDLGWRRFQKDLPIQLNVHKLPGTISVMTPEVVREFGERAGLVVEEINTEISRRDCIALLRKPDES